MDFNFFGWLRDGVRRSVLLGVSDAVEEIGSPEGTDEPGFVFESLQLGAKNATKKVAGKSTRKRLGKSLKDI